MKKGKLALLIFGLIFIIILLAACSANNDYSVGIIDMEYLLEESQRAGQLSHELTEISSQLQQEYIDDEQAADDQAIDQAYQMFLINKEEIEEQLDHEIYEVVAEIKEEQGMDIVIYKDSVHYGGEDITAEVISRLDSRFYQGEAADDR